MFLQPFMVFLVFLIQTLWPKRNKLKNQIPQGIPGGLIN